MPFKPNTPEETWMQLMLQNIDQPGFAPPAAMEPNPPAEKPKPFWDMEDPINQMSAMSAALGMLQPYRPGQSPLGHAAQSLQGGLETMSKLKLARRGQDTERRKVDVTEQAGKRRDVLKAEEIANEQKYREDILGPYYERLGRAQANPEGFSEEARWSLALEAATKEWQATMENNPEEIHTLFPDGVRGRARQLMQGFGQRIPTTEELKAQYEAERAAAAKSGGPTPPVAPVAQGPTSHQMAIATGGGTATSAPPTPAVPPGSKGDIIAVHGEPKSGAEVLELARLGTLDHWRKQGFDVRKFIELGMTDLGAKDRKELAEYLK